MRMVSPRVVAGVALGWFLLSVPPAAATDPGAASLSAADRKGVEAIVDGFGAAWNRHDAKALAALFTEQADFVNVIGLHWKGREEIERAHAEIHATRMKNSHLAILSRSARPLSSDVVLVHATWELEGDTGIEGKPLPTRKGVLSFVVARQGGRWLAESAQNTDIVPLPNAPPAR
jgi:uncharacterized protein (TIGR02246 family)